MTDRTDKQDDTTTKKQNVYTGWPQRETHKPLTIFLLLSSYSYYAINHFYY